MDGQKAKELNRPSVTLHLEASILRMNCIRKFYNVDAASPAAREILCQYGGGGGEGGWGVKNWEKHRV